VYFLFKKLTTVNFNIHFYAYENFTDQWYYLKFQDLTVHTAINIRITASGFVSLYSLIFLKEIKKSLRFLFLL